RIVNDRVPMWELLIPATNKLKRLEMRLNDLVPDSNMSNAEKIDSLVDKIYATSSEKSDSTCVEILERMGDKRAGIDPVR
ncbi:MAG: hypothetical protein R3261_15425, partial [Alphaproteobacteria bacterium]|nr:hypothetical protein [Alphaproteobacteria bacterium]